MSNAGELYGRPWSESEYIVVLHYYVENRDKPRHHLCDYVKEVARLIGRTPGAVVMRMENFASLDPLERGQRTGLPHMSHLGRSVFAAWIDQPESLRACASVLVRDLRAVEMPTLFNPDPVRMPRAFGRYELLDLIGDGAFGSVYSCLSTVDDRPYAIKIIRTNMLDEPEIVSRFRREIRALKALNNNHVIRIHEDNLDSTPHFPAFVMDLAECSLARYLHTSLAPRADGERRPTLPPGEASQILGEVLEGVGALHANDPMVLHRDIKPDNILRMPDARWVLADFSLAKFAPNAVVATTFATSSRQGWGTEGYSAPEQFQDFRLADQRADVYSLGVLVWELFSPAWPPFDRSQHGLSRALESVVVRATDRDRQRRHGSIVEFRADLASALQAEGTPLGGLHG